MKGKTVRKKNKFLIFLLIWAAVLLLASVALWSVLSSFLNAYENSQPGSAVKEYIAEISSEQVESLASPLLSELSPLQSRDSVVQELLERIQSSVPVKYSRESNDEQTVYYLRSNGEYIEKLVFVPGGESFGFGKSAWKLSSEEFLLKSLGAATEIKVPSDYSVYLDGEKLDSSYISEENIEYELFEGFYEAGYSLPYLCSYSTGLLSGSHELSVKDSKGNLVPEDCLTEACYLDNCTQAEKEGITAFVNEYIPAYVQFTSNSNRSTDLNYYYVIQYVLSGSVLEDRLRDAKKSNGFNMSNGDEVTSIDCLEFYNLDGKNYIVNIEFCYETTGLHKEITSNVNRLKLMLRLSSTGAYQAEYMVQY